MSVKVSLDLQILSCLTGLAPLRMLRMRCVSKLDFKMHAMFMKEVCVYFLVTAWMLQVY